MSFALKIETDNDAFNNPDDDTDSSVALAEIARLLRRVADQLDEGNDHGVIHDLNGNRVGSFSL